MKLVQLVLALYVMVLSALPCEGLCLDEAASTSAQTAAPISDDYPHDEWCSPFCQCATCPGFALPARLELATGGGAIDPPLSGYLSIYLSGHLLDVLSRIWQPPRLRQHRLYSLPALMARQLLAN